MSEQNNMGKQSHGYFQSIVWYSAREGKNSRKWPFEKIWSDM